MMECLCAIPVAVDKGEVARPMVSRYAALAANGLDFPPAKGHTVDILAGLIRIDSHGFALSEKRL
jgi:hypothetical protein